MAAARKAAAKGGCGKERLESETAAMMRGCGRQRQMYGETAVDNALLV